MQTRRFLLRFQDTKDIETLEMFKKVVAFREEDITDTITRIIKEYVRTNYPKDRVLVTERELFKSVTDNGLNISKSYIINCRRDGKLNGCFFTDSTRHVVYDRNKTIDVLIKLKGNVA